MPLINTNLSGRAENSFTVFDFLAERVRLPETSCPAESWSNTLELDVKRARQGKDLFDANNAVQFEEVRSTLLRHNEQIISWLLLDKQGNWNNAEEGRMSEGRQIHRKFRFFYGA